MHIIKKFLLIIFNALYGHGMFIINARVPGAADSCIIFYQAVISVHHRLE